MATRYLYPGMYGIFFVALFSAVLFLGWDRGWALVSVYAHQESFNDIRILHAAVQSAADGFDPTLENPRHFAGKLMNYPLVWMSIANAIDFGNETKFLAITIAYLAAFFISLGYLIYRFPSVTLLLAGMSGVVVTAFETGNVDTVFFVVMLIVALVPRTIVRSSLILLSAMLKLFPIFAIPVLIEWSISKTSLIRRLLPTVGVACLFLVYLSLNYASIRHAMDITPKAGLRSYGMWVISFLINERAPDLGVGLVELYVLFAIAIAPAFLFVRPLVRMIGFPASGAEPEFQLKRDLFLIGGFIYFASYLTTSNWDYRLLFALFTVPFVLSTKNRLVRTAFSISLFVAVNQFLLVGLHQSAGGAVNILAKATLHYILTVLLIAYCFPFFLHWISPGKPAD